MRTITLDELLSWRPCYSRARILQVTGGREVLTLREVCDLKAPPADLLWVLLRPAVLPELVLGTLACDFAERALEAERVAGREPDARSWEALAVRRRHLQGDATNQELKIAQRNAYAAAADVAAAAVAADVAVTYAVVAAAAVAADVAAVAVTYAAYAKSRNDEQQWQLGRVRETIDAMEVAT